MKLHSFTFHDSGVELEIKKVNPALVTDMRRLLDMAKPKPPVEVITAAGPLQGKEVPNDGDPEYVAKLEKHERYVQDVINEFYINRGVNKILVDDWQREVKELRSQFADMKLAGALPKDDKTVYIMRIAAGTSEDLQDLFDAIMRRSEPTQGDVDANLNTFQPNVQR